MGTGMFERLSKRLIRRKKRVANFTAVLILVLSILVPAPAFSSGNLFGGPKGGIKSIRPENGKIVDGVVVTQSQQLILYVEFEGGSPSHIQICDNEMFELCEWQRMRFDGRITYTLSEGAGMKKIYLRAKYLGRPAKTAVLTVNYMPK